MYVREAYRLLQKSIIFVENEDVELDDNEEVRQHRIFVFLYLQFEIPRFE